MAQPVIVKKIKKGGGDGHHGGAWKVAYADFVTAMMAFFLLMWLLNATSEEQRKGLADFFDPQLPISRNSAGGAGMLAGDEIMAEDTLTGTQSEGQRPKPTHDERGENLGDNVASPDLPPGDVTPNMPDVALALPPGDNPTATMEFGVGPEAGIGNAPGDAGTGEPRQGAIPGQSDAEAAAEARARAAEERTFEALTEALTGYVSRMAGDDALAGHFEIRMSPEGLVIELVDQVGTPLFGAGASSPSDVLTELIDIIVPVLGATLNDIAVVGHTDASPVGRSGYSNWELSTDRANAARRLMVDRGLDPDRITRISGEAATNPIDADPFSAKNRRVAITLLRGGRR